MAVERPEMELLRMLKQVGALPHHRIVPRLAFVVAPYSYTLH